MNTDEEYFENNLIPKLLAAYEEVRVKGTSRHNIASMRTRYWNSDIKAGLGLKHGKAQTSEKILVTW